MKLELLYSTECVLAAPFYVAWPGFTINVVRDIKYLPLAFCLPFDDVRIGQKEGSAAKTSVFLTLATRDKCRRVLIICVCFRGGV